MTSSNPPAPILSGSHLISNSGPSQVSYSCDFEKTEVFLSITLNGVIQFLVVIIATRSSVRRCLPCDPLQYY